MADLALEWKSDLSLDDSGDLGVTDGPDLTRQRIVRRLFTAIRGYIWHPSYGAGLPQRIGRTARQSVIQSIVRSQIALESSVAQSPPPLITVAASSATPGLYVVAIRYTDAVTGVATSIQLQVPGRD